MSRLCFLPFWMEAVSSPKYQTLPSESCAYQSSVISLAFPWSYTTSWTTRAVTPSAIFLVRFSTLITSWSSSPSGFVTRTSQRAPTGIGQ